MVAEELSQDEIDSLFGDSGDGDSEGSLDNEINESVRKLFELLNDSLEEVLKTAFSLEVVSKFTDLSVKKGEEITLDNKVLIVVGLSSDKASSEFHLMTDKRFASILSDLMLMGPGEAKDELEPDDLDALKELFSQVFGNLSTALKDTIPTPITIEVKEVKGEAEQFSDAVYFASYDVALPNIEDGVIEAVGRKDELDSLFIQEEEKKEEEPEEVPFKDVEEEGKSKPASRTEETVQKSEEAPKNLDLIMDIDLEVKIRIGEKYMLIKDILELKDGSIIELDKSIEEPMDVLVNGKVVAKGVVVVVGGKFGIKLTHIETREERIKSLGG